MLAFRREDPHPAWTRSIDISVLVHLQAIRQVFLDCRGRVVEHGTVLNGAGRAADV